MKDPDAAAALRACLAEFDSAASGALIRTIHQHVCDYVDELKALGWPPERVLVAVKRVADESGVRRRNAIVLEDSSLTARERLVARLVRWCIDRYFAPEPAEDWTSKPAVPTRRRSA